MPDQRMQKATLFSFLHSTNNTNTSKLTRTALSLAEGGKGEGGTAALQRGQHAVLVSCHRSLKVTYRASLSEGCVEEESSGRE